MTNNEAKVYNAHLRTLERSVELITPHYELACDLIHDHVELDSEQMDWAQAAGFVIAKFNLSAQHEHNLYVLQTIRQIARNADYLSRQAALLFPL